MEGSHAYAPCPPICPEQCPHWADLRSDGFESLWLQGCPRCRWGVGENEPSVEVRTVRSEISPTTFRGRMGWRGGACATLSQSRMRSGHLPARVERRSQDGHLLWPHPKGPVKMARSIWDSGKQEPRKNQIPPPFDFVSSRFSPRSRIGARVRHTPGLTVPRAAGSQYFWRLLRPCDHSAFFGRTSRTPLSSASLESKNACVACKSARARSKSSHHSHERGGRQNAVTDRRPSIPQSSSAHGAIQS